VAGGDCVSNGPPDVLFKASLFSKSLFPPFFIVWNAGKLRFNPRSRRCRFFSALHKSSSRPLKKRRVQLRPMSSGYFPFFITPGVSSKRGSARPFHALFFFFGRHCRLCRPRHNLPPLRIEWNLRCFPPLPLPPLPFPSIRVASPF